MVQHGTQVQDSTRDGAQRKPTNEADHAAEKESEVGGTRPKLPRLDLGRVSEENRLSAPVTVDRLLTALRARSRPVHDTAKFQKFEDRVNDLLDTKKLDPAFRIHTFYDESIIPSGSAFATPRTTRPVGGESPLEIIFGFFCGRQQPGTGYVHVRRGQENKESKRLSDRDTAKE